jgi:hypothetical protein
MDKLAKQQACQLFIEQEIDKGLAAGEAKPQIGKRLAEWIEKLFDAKVKPRTIEQRARRIETSATNVASESTQGNDSRIEEKQDKQEIVRDDKGRFVEGTPMAPGPGRPPKFSGHDVIAEMKDGMKGDGVDLGDPPEETLPVVGPHCIGMQYARIAIINLEQIDRDDSEREQAFEAVRTWLNEHK